MVKTSSDTAVRALYEKSADDYARMMDTEIELPIYAETLGRLAKNMAGIQGLLVDTSCGSGHMLALYHTRFDAERPLIGIDLSPHMVSIATNRLGAAAVVLTGDMRNLTTVDNNSAAGVISFFAIHHLDPEEVLIALWEWRRVLQPGGRLVIAAWEGTGLIDYGDDSEIMALNYGKDELSAWVQSAGFIVDRCAVEPVEEMPMQALYLEAKLGTHR